jgi:hypothetical protein
MAAEDAALQSMTATMSLALNGTVYLCKGTAYVISQLCKAMMFIHLDLQKKKELSPGQKKLAAMIASGKTTQVFTMKKEDFDKFSKHDLKNGMQSLAEKYGIQYAAIDMTKTTDNDKDYVTVFIDRNCGPQFQQLCKDYGFDSVEDHGIVDSVPEKPYTKDTLVDLFNDPAELAKYGINNPELHDKSQKFNFAEFYHDEIKKGMDPEGVVPLLHPLSVLCSKNEYVLDLTDFELIIPGLEKEVEKIKQGELSPVEPAVTENSITSNDTTKSSEKPTEPLNENDVVVESSITESELFEAPDIIPDIATEAEPSLAAIDKLGAADPLSYADKITEITEESKVTDIVSDLDPSVSPEIK